MSQTVKTLSVNRLAALSDGIFAIAMTILVLNISMPDSETVKEIGLHRALWQQMDQFYSYLLSFFLLGIFWIIQHRQMSLLERTDQTHIWINIWLLMFICLIPFSASIQSEYGNHVTAAVIFSGNMLIVGLIFLVDWIYATGKNRLVSEDYPREQAQRGKKNILIFISVTIAALICAFIIPDWSGIVFLLIPLVKRLN